MLSCVRLLAGASIGGQQVVKEGTKGEKSLARKNEKKKCNYSGGNDNEVYILITRGRAARWCPRCDINTTLFLHPPPPETTTSRRSWGDRNTSSHNAENTHDEERSTGGKELRQEERRNEEGVIAFHEECSPHGVMIYIYGRRPTNLIYKLWICPTIHFFSPSYFYLRSIQSKYSQLSSIYFRTLFFFKLNRIKIFFFNYLFVV